MNTETYDDLKQCVGSKNSFTDDLLNMGYTKGKKDGYNQALEELAEFFHREYVFDSICRDDCSQAKLVDMVDGFVEQLKR